MELRDAHRVTIRGEGPRSFLLAHGLGSDQGVWAPIADLLEPHGRVITFDLAGWGGFDPAAFSHGAHESVFGYADDLLRLCHALDVQGCIYVGHSVSGMAGLLASLGDATMFSHIVTIGGSPCYADDPASTYVGGHTSDELRALLAAMEADYQLWATGFGRLVVDDHGSWPAANDFTDNLRRAAPDVALTAFRAVLTSDVRHLLADVTVPTLVINGRYDPMVPLMTARWLADAIPSARLHTIAARGHLAHLAEAEAVVEAILDFTGV